MLEAGRQFGNYRIEQLVGRGGQGFVYRAVHVQLGSVHAVKLLLLERGPLRERLLDEGRIQARLRHPNLVPVTDVVEVDGALALVAEFVAGVPLDAWVAAEQPSLAVRLEVFRGVCAAVAAAHAARVVHRDLKPGNVLVETIDGRSFPRVTDFGVAKLLDPIPGQSVTLPGLPVGTPGYMAPEQLRDASSVDARADIFALGCLLYELTCGARPFPDSDLATYAAALTTGAFVALDDCMEALPPELGRTVAACLQVDPDARPADMAQVLALLDGVMPGDLPVSASIRTPTRDERDAPSPTYVPHASVPPASVPPALFRTLSFPPSLRPRRRTLRWIVLTGAIVATAALTATGITALGRMPPEATAVAPVAVESPPPAAPVATFDPTASSLVAAEPPAVPPAVSPTAASPTPASPPAAAPTGTSPRVAVAVEAAPSEPRGPRPGSVVSSGEGTIVWLTAGDRRHPPNDVPAGHYTVLARFPGDDALVTAGSVAIQPGRTTRLKCGAAQQMCVPEEGR